MGWLSAGKGEVRPEPANKPEYLLVHESDSPWGSVEVIDVWHRARGFRAIGYHYVIGNAWPTHVAFREGSPDPKHDGKLLPGRDLDYDDLIDEEVGAHCPGFNTRSIAVCLIGRNGEYSAAQLATLFDFLEGKCRQYGIPAERILGHCETPSGRRQGKRCPSLDMEEVRRIVAMRLQIGTMRRSA